MWPIMITPCTKQLKWMVGMNKEAKEGSHLSDSEKFARFII